jgi:pyruvate formate lyase activating enzyme
MRFKPYWKTRGGVTFSGGEPLLQIDFLVEVCKELKSRGVHIALDTAGVGIGKYEELLPYIDLILYDVKYVDDVGFIKLTGHHDEETFKFLKVANELEKKFIVRQVIVPGLTDSKEYMIRLNEYIKHNIKNVEKVEFLPYHKLGSEKYDKLGILNPYKDLIEMDKEKCDELYNMFCAINKK